MSTSGTLKIGGETPVPGLALPEAFESLEQRLDSTLQLSRLGGSPSAQTLGLVTVCQEMERLLKLAFIENGMLASRIELLTRHRNETVNKLERRLLQVEMENKITRKHMKRLRKRLSAFEVLRKKKCGDWWDISVATNDYETLSVLSKITGSPDLEFMLRVNQIMIDFVKDKLQLELVLPPMGSEERQELAKLASVYKLRCRYGKSNQVASSTLIKARQTCIPAAGEVDAVLGNFTKTRRLNAEELESQPGEDAKTASDTVATDKDVALGSPLSSVPPTMLTPLSSLSSPPVIDLSFSQAASATPSDSQPGSGLQTPVETAPTKPSRNPLQRDVGSSTPSLSESPFPPPSSSLPKQDFTPTKSSEESSEPRSSSPLLSAATNVKSPTVKVSSSLVSSRQPSGGSLRSSVPPSSALPAASKPLASSSTAMRPVGHSMVVASPLKLSQMPSAVGSPLEARREKAEEEEVSGGKEREKEREREKGATPAKRMRITRRSASIEEVEQMHL